MIRDPDGGATERSGAKASLRSSRPGAPRRAPWLLAKIDRWPAVLVHVVAAVLTAAVGALDVATGTELSFSIFYLAPVSLVAWRLGGRAGSAWAGVAAVVWLAVDVSPGGLPGRAVDYWNAGVRLGFFLVVTATLARIRSRWQSERTLAGMDHLTGVLNGRAFREIIDMERSRALRYNRPFTLAYMDVDDFKRINDERGHSAGDDALQLVAATIKENIRSMDSVARLGGDEFGLLLPETGTESAEVALRKIQGRLTEAAAEAGLNLTFSIGALVCVGPPDSVDQLIRKADALMYAVKRGGRNGLRMEVLDDNFGIEAILRRS